MIARLLISAVAVWVTAWLLPGVSIEPWWAAVIVAVLLGLINTFVRPVVKLFFTDHMTVDGFVPALLFGIVLAVVNWVLHLVVGKK